MKRWLIAAIVWCAGCGGEAAPTAPGNGTRTPTGGAAAGAAPGCPAVAAQIADAFPVAATDGAFFYGFGARTLERLPKAGGASEVLVRGLDTTIVRSLAVDERDAFWLAPGSDASHPGYVLRAPKAGVDRAMQLAISATPSQLLLDATHVYWIETTGGAVARVAKHDDQRAQSVLVGADPAGRGAAIAIDGGFVYHAIDSLELDGSTHHALRRVPIAGGADVELARLPDAIALLAANEAAIFAATDGGIVTRVNKANGVRITWRAPDDLFDALALDGHNVYVATHDASGGGHLARAAEDGSALTILAAERVTTPLVIDGDSVYFNALERVCK